MYESLSLRKKITNGNWVFSHNYYFCVIQTCNSDFFSHKCEFISCNFDFITHKSQKRSQNCEIKSYNNFFIHGNALPWQRVFCVTISIFVLVCVTPPTASLTNRILLGCQLTKTHRITAMEAIKRTGSEIRGGLTHYAKVGHSLGPPKAKGPLKCFSNTRCTQ